MRMHVLSGKLKRVPSPRTASIRERVRSLRTMCSVRKVSVSVQMRSWRPQRDEAHDGSQ